MNLQEKLESANRLYEDLKKGKEELDARKEIYERLACVCIHNTRPVCSSVQNTYIGTQCVIMVRGLPLAALHTHTHTAACWLCCRPFHAFVLGGTMHTQRGHGSLSKIQLTFAVKQVCLCWNSDNFSHKFLWG